MDVKLMMMMTDLAVNMYRFHQGSDNVENHEPHSIHIIQVFDFLACSFFYCFDLLFRYTTVCLSFSICHFSICHLGSRVCKMSPNYL